VNLEHKPNLCPPSSPSSAGEAAPGHSAYENSGRAPYLRKGVLRGAPQLLEIAVRDVEQQAAPALPHRKENRLIRKLGEHNQIYNIRHT
jgi:hypothetical protein